MKYVQRIKETLLKQFIELNQPDKQVLVVSGARQVGKTTLIDHVLSSTDREVLRLDLEKKRSLAEKIDQTRDFDEFERLLKDECAFRPAGGQILFMDESQTSKRLGGYVRFMKESWGAATTILSGSLISELAGDDARSPVGREKFLDLWPFVFREFLSAIGHDSLAETLSSFRFGDEMSELAHSRLLEDYDLYLKIGGLPAVIAAHLAGDNWQDAIIDIYKTYEDDFVRYFGIENSNLFRRALAGCAANAGSPSKMSQVVKVDAPGYKKVADVLARLERWQLVIKVEQLGKAPEQHVFPPKRYLCDLGLLGYLRFRARPFHGIADGDDVFLKTALGGVIENAIAISLVNQAREATGVRMSKGSEIDFVIKSGKLTVPVECKSSRTFKLPHAFLVENYCRLFRLRHGIVFNLDMPHEIDRDGIAIHSLPVYLADETMRLMAET